MSDTHTIARPAPEPRRILAPVPATAAQLIPTAGVARDLREWEANEIGASADERFSANGGR